MKFLHVFGHQGVPIVALLPTTAQSGKTVQMAGIMKHMCGTSSCSKSQKQGKHNMSLDIDLVKTCDHCGHTDQWDANVTHNLTDMAEAAGLYYLIWRPEELGLSKAGQLVAGLETGLKQLKDDPETFKKHNPSNGWGSYDGFVRFVEKYLIACKERPDHDIQVSR